MNDENHDQPLINPNPASSESVISPRQTESGEAETRTPQEKVAHVRQNTMKQHFVIFLSPGTLFSEQTSKPIDSWDVNKAVEMSETILERYNARPYAFQFATRERGPNDLDSKETKRSGNYFLGGRVMTLAQVEREMPDERILISNMKRNGYHRSVVSETPWRSIHPLAKGDVVIPVATKQLPVTSVGRGKEKV